MKYLFLLLSISFNILSYTLYKFISNRQNDWIWYSVFILGLIFGAVNTYFFTKSLREINLGVAYPIFSGACIVLMLLVGTLMFKEKVTSTNIIGIIIIIIGIIFTTR